MAKNITKLRHRLPLIKAITDNWLIFVLATFSLVLAYLNYQPGTILTGWDNLHPEYNFEANIRRSIFAVWQEYQGTGLLGGHAHASDLLRQLFLYLASSFINVSFIRYFWTFLMLTIGPLGVYLFLSKVFLLHKFDQKTIHFASFLGGLYYLLNLSTLQHFFTPFETFTAFYGFFPFLITTFTAYLNKPSIKRFILLSLTALVSSPAFYTETLFVVYGLCLLSLLADHYFSSRHKESSLKESIAALFAVVLPNAFWLLPVTFFVLVNGNIGLNAKINSIASSETYLRNLAFGNLTNLSLLKGFWFGFLDLSTGGKFDYLLLNWRHHIESPIVLLIGFGSFALVITGVIYSLVKKIRFSKGILGIFLLCFFFLLGGGLLLNKTVPILGELFRSPFTKFSSALAFSYSVFFAIGSVFLLDLFSFIHSRLTYYLTLFSVTVALVVFMTPAFTGNLISPTMRLRVPSEYFELMGYFKQADQAVRIANFPQHTFWGWNYYDWGYRGSGFLWYGIRQPILDRAFDVWEATSEKYYEEISTALYSNNLSEFESLLNKYAITYLVVDRHLISPDGDNNSLYTEKLISLLDSLETVKLETSFADKILVYKTSVPQSVDKFLSVEDQPEITSPFDHLPLRPFTPNSLTSDQIELSVPLKSGLLTVPSYSQTENLVATAISYRKTGFGVQIRFTPLLPEVKIGDQIVTGEIPSVTTDFVITSFSGLILGVNDTYVELQLPDELTDQASFYPLTNLYLPTNEAINITLFSNQAIHRVDLTSGLKSAVPVQCYTNKPNRKIEKLVDQDTISLLGTDVVGCLSVPLPPSNSLNQLISLEFSYDSPTGTPGNANITDSALGGQFGPQPFLAKTESTFTRIFTKSRLEPLQANLILEANEIKNTQEINYRNVSVNYLPQLGESNLFIPSSSAFDVIIDEPSTLSVSIPIVDNPLTLVSSVDNNLFSSTARNCDNFNQGEVERNATEEGFLYTAINANSCDQINLKHLPHTTNYALIVDAINLSGLPTSFCFENYATRRCDIFERANPNLDKQIIIQPINNRTEPPGYSLHLFNESFGTRQTRNLINSIVVTPFPKNFLNAFVLTQTSPLEKKAYRHTSNHPNEFIYTLSTENDQPTFVNLYQTKSTYWKAVQVPKEVLSLPIPLLIARLPFIYFFNQTSSPHLIHSDQNLWYNSWELASGNHHLVIFYLPQYLEFVGFLFLPFPLLIATIYLIFRRIRNKKSPR